jgi:hypothetical protein
MTRFLRFVCPVLSVGLLAAGHFRSGLDWSAAGLLVFGILWIVGLALRWGWIPPLGMFVAFGVAAAGLFLDPLPVFLVFGALFALLAWDLAEFYLRLRLASPEDDIAALEKPHLLRLCVLVLAGGVLSAFALMLHLKPSFEWMVVLMVFAVWGVGRMVYWLLNKES